MSKRQDTVTVSTQQGLHRKTAWAQKGHATQCEFHQDALKNKIAWLQYMQLAAAAISSKEVILPVNV